jgi:hypothetical protein
MRPLPKAASFLVLELALVLELEQGLASFRDE